MNPINLVPSTIVFLYSLHSFPLFALRILYTLELYIYIFFQIVELEAGSGIFAEKGVLCSLEHFGKRAAGVAMALLNMVFTPQALVSLSVKGNRAKGAHRPCEQRPPLHAGALQAILCELCP